VGLEWYFSTIRIIIPDEGLVKMNLPNKDGDGFPKNGLMRNNEYPVLIAGQGPLDGHQWEITHELIIGRDPDCDIRIDDRQVSRHHARLAFSGGKVELEDLGSKNGTFHAGKQIKQNTILMDTDIIQVAMIQKFVYYTSDATMPMEDLLPDLSSHDGRLFVDDKSRRVWVQGKEVTPALSAPQFRLLSEMVRQSGRVVTRNELIHAIWADEEAEGVSEQALDALIRRLRERLAEFDPTHNYVVTVRGHGLRLSER
jgi:hypothetical protein